MLNVIDLTEGAAGPFATLLLAEIGADVVKVEPPGSGDTQRGRSESTPEDLSFDFLNRHKRSVTLDLAGGGRERLLVLIADADVVVESFAPGTLVGWGLAFRTMKRINPKIVLTSITPFGQNGPHAQWKATDLVLQAMGGTLAATGDDDGPPRKLAGHQASYVAGLQAAISTLAAVRGVHAGVEDGVHIDVSIQEAMSTHWTREITRYIYTGQNTARASKGPGPQGYPQLVTTADGYLLLLALRSEWKTFAGFLGIDEFATDEWSDPQVRLERWEEIAPHFERALASQGRYEWVEAGAERGYQLAPVDDPYQVLHNPQLDSRGFFQTAELSEGGAVQSPRLPFTFAAESGRPNRAPRLGEHNDEFDSTEEVPVNTP